ncbi:MAG: ABC transporter substrate-binding protein [Candidatus Accumulibacter sp.]|jgi:NitT/TauT family transport system substrate-binding protein|nr:ABC transporter substrate-binding protein [Accumulibacter sp.]
MRKITVFAASLLLAVSVGAARAEKTEITISKQYGIHYLPLIVAEDLKLIEKHAKAAGLGEVKTNWATFSGGAAANDALLSGSVDLVSGGTAPLIRIWAKTKGTHNEVKALAALDQIPLTLNTNNAKVKTIADFSDNDRIALPAVKVSIQSLILEIAAAKAFGKENYARLDKLTVSLSHPDAVTALTSGKSEITAHFANEPFTSVELKNANIHRVFNSFEVFGGRHTTNIVWTSSQFVRENPKLTQAIVAAVKEAVDWILADKKRAAELYVRATKSRDNVSFVHDILISPDVNYAARPLDNFTIFSDFLFDSGEIKHKAANVRELFFDPVFE